jgi:hypothetical protein
MNLENFNIFSKNHDFWGIGVSPREPFSPSKWPPNYKKTKLKNVSFSESLLGWFGCICGCLFPSKFTLVRIPKANERKSTNPYETLPLCSEIKGWPFERHSKIRQKSQKSEQKNASENERWKNAFWERFGLPLGSLLGDFSPRNASQKNTRKTTTQELNGPHRESYQATRKNYL